MGLFSGSKEIKSLKDTIAKIQRNSFNQLLDFRPKQAIYPDWNQTEIVDTYCNSDDIYSIIRLLATTSCLVPMYVYEQKNSKAYNRYFIEQKRLNQKGAKEIQKKELEDLPPDDLVENLLENPNPQQTKFEFFESVFSFLYLSGETFILKERAGLGANANRVVAMRVLFPENVIINISESYEVISYDYKVDGVIKFANISPSDVIHVKLFNPNSDQHEGLRGLSPITVLSQRLARSKANMDASVAQLQNGGMTDIVFDKLPIDESGVQIIGQRTANFYKFIGNKSNKGAPYFAQGEMGGIKLGSSLADMGVKDLENVDFKKLCNAFGISDVLFNSGDTNSENNVKIQTKRLYTNSVLPNVYRVRDAMQKNLLDEFQNGIDIITDEEVIRVKGDGKDRVLIADITDIQELQEDMGSTATWLSTAWWITGNEKREIMKYDQIDNEFFNEPLIPSGLIPLAELTAVPDIPMITPNGN